MSVETVKSASVTALDASPTGRVTGGQGAQAYEWTVNDFALVPAASSVTSKFFLLRVPCDVKMKNLVWESDAMGAGKFDVGLWYSANTYNVDGTPFANKGLVIDQDFFASDLDCAAALPRTSIINESGNYPIQKRNQPLWQAVGLSALPGGFFDIIAVVHTTAVTTGAAYISAEGKYVW